MDSYTYALGWFWLVHGKHLIPCNYSQHNMKESPIIMCLRNAYNKRKFYSSYIIVCVHVVSQPYKSTERELWSLFTKNSLYIHLLRSNFHIQCLWKAIICKHIPPFKHRPRCMGFNCHIYYMLWSFKAIYNYGKLWLLIFPLPDTLMIFNSQLGSCSIVFFSDMRCTVPYHNTWV